MKTRSLNRNYKLSMNAYQDSYSEFRVHNKSSIILPQLNRGFQIVD